MSTALIIVIVFTLFTFGFVTGIIGSIWYYEKVIKPVEDEQRRKAVDDNYIPFDCEQA